MYCNHGLKEINAVYEMLFNTEVFKNSSIMLNGAVTLIMRQSACFC
jgi:hypothetical protein